MKITSLARRSSRFLTLLWMTVALVACGGGDDSDQNDAPTVSSASFDVTAGTDLSATLNATDPENNTVTFTKTSDPAHGEIVSFATSGAFTYRPDTGFSGTDSFNVSASDGTNSVTATVTLSVNFLAQSLSFTQSGPLKVFIGDTVSNVATSEGTGTVTYSSSDPAVATVDADGLVTVLAAGSAQIHAAKAADATYSAAEASYTLDSSATSVSFTSWTGAQDSEVTFPASAAGLEFYRSSESGCELANYVGCADGQMNVLTNAAVTDTAATLNRPGYYTLKHGDTVASLTLDATQATGAAFSARYFHQVVVYQGRLWLIGGADSSRRNDVWSSSDGINWTRQTASAAFSARSGHQVVVYQDQLWLIGGVNSSSTRQNDVWSSSDGITWTQQTSSAAFPSRAYHQVVVYQDQLWLIGGYDGRGMTDVWSSSDGITWTEQTGSANFSARYYHQVVAYQGQLWLIGGYDTDSALYANDVWSSTDGITWTQQTASAAFSARASHQVKVYQDRLWLIAGNDDVAKNDVWSSSDGITWTEQTASAPFSVRYHHQAVVYQDRLLVIGGYNGANNVRKNDVWSSTNGADWRLGLHETFNFQ